MTRNLAARIERLEAAKRSPSKIIGILNYCDSQGWPQWDGVHRPGIQVIGVIGGVRTPREDWPEVCASQQRSLMAELAEFAALLGEEAPPDAQAPGIVGTPAPLKPGQKARNFIHLPDGTEILLKRT
ncbi:MAG: hypothetical protein WEB56_00410 [Roseovarius sp.]